MNKKQTLWAVIAVVIIIGALVFYRQWQMDSLVSGLNLDLENGLLAEPETVDGETYLVPSEYVFDSGAELPALNDPDFTYVTDADSYLSDEVDGVSIEIGAEQYFFSYQILNWHEVVNMNDAGLAVTHCMLCRSSAVYETQEPLMHAGKVYNNNLLLMDESSGSYWNQFTGMAIVGDRAGEELTSYPSEVMTWGEWKDLYPNGSVLSTDTGYDRDYTRHPFENYDVADLYYFPLNQIDDRMSAKWIVDGLDLGDMSVAYSRDIMKGIWVHNFTHGNLVYVAMYDTEDEVTRVFTAGSSFTYDNEENVFVDQDGGTWSADGVALTGAQTGTQLDQVQTQSSFYMCWYANHTDTFIASIDLMDEAGEGESDE